MNISDTPLVSVCVITYNHVNYIRQCLESILMQKTDFSYEIVIGEDCSTDDTKAVIMEFEALYPDIIKPIYHKINVGGLRNAYEFCYAKVRGEYIAVCEGDDYWTDSNKLQKQVDFLEKNHEYSLCFHKINSVDKNNKIIENGVDSNKITRYQPKDIFHLKIPTLSIVYRNCIDFSRLLKLQLCDYVLFGLLSNYGGAADLGFVGGNYRKHDGGVYTRMSMLTQYRGTLLLLKSMKRYDVFSSEQKAEIGKEIYKRRKRYIKKFLKKKELVNCLKIVFT